MKEGIKDVISTCRGEGRASCFGAQTGIWQEHHSFGLERGRMGHVREGWRGELGSDEDFAFQVDENRFEF